MRDLLRCGYGHPRRIRLLCIADNILHRLGNRVCDAHHSVTRPPVTPPGGVSPG